MNRCFVMPVVVGLMSGAAFLSATAADLTVSGLGDCAAANRLAIQRAVDEVSAQGGGRVTLPVGVWTTGSIRLKDGVELHLPKGATLKGSLSAADYNVNDEFPENFWREGEEWSGGHLVYAHHAQNVAITGEGVLDGNGSAFFGECDEDSRWPGYKYGLKLHPLDRAWFRPGPMVAVFCSKGIRIEGVTLTNTPCWTCHLRCCDGVTLRGVTIDADRTIANSDGFSIDCTRNVLVEKCVIKTGDDGFAIRASCKLHAATNACENIVIRDCDVWSCCYAIRFGIGSGTIRNIDVIDTRLHEASKSGFGFTTAWIASKRDCYIEDIRVRNCTVAECVNPVHVELSAGDSHVTGVKFESCTFSTLLPICLTGGERMQMSFSNCVRHPIEKLRVRHRRGWGEREIRNGRNVFADVRGDLSKVTVENCKPEPFGTHGVLALSVAGRSFADWERWLPVLSEFEAHLTFFVEGEFDPAAVRTAKRLMSGGHSIGIRGQSAELLPTVIRQFRVAYVPVRVMAGAEGLSNRQLNGLERAPAMEEVAGIDAVIDAIRRAASSKVVVRLAAKGDFLTPEALKRILSAARESEVRVLGLDDF